MGSNTIMLTVNNLNETIMLKSSSMDICNSPVAVTTTSSTPYSDATQTKKHPPNHIKRPMNAFMVWSQTQRRALQKDTSVHHAEISKTLGAKWKKMTNEEKKPFFDEAARLRELHNQEFPDYKYKPKKKKSGDSSAKSTSPRAVHTGRIEKKRPQSRSAVVAATKKTRRLSQQILEATYYLHSPESNSSMEEMSESIITAEDFTSESIITAADFTTPPGRIISSTDILVSSFGSNDDAPGGIYDRKPHFNSECTWPESTHSPPTSSSSRCITYLGQTSPSSEETLSYDENVLGIKDEQQTSLGKHTKGLDCMPKYVSPVAQETSIANLISCTTEEHKQNIVTCNGERNYQNTFAGLGTTINDVFPLPVHENSTVLHTPPHSPPPLFINKHSPERINSSSNPSSISWHANIITSDIKQETEGFLEKLFSKEEIKSEYQYIADEFDFSPYFDNDQQMVPKHEVTFLDIKDQGDIKSEVPCNFLSTSSYSDTVDKPIFNTQYSSNHYSCSCRNPSDSIDVLPGSIHSTLPKYNQEDSSKDFLNIYLPDENMSFSINDFSEVKTDSSIELFPEISDCFSALL